MVTLSESRHQFNLNYEINKPEINKINYQERLEKLDLPTLTYRQYWGWMIEICKILHNMYDTNFNNSLLGLKEPNTCGNKFAVKVIKNQH